MLNVDHIEKDLVEKIYYVIQNGKMICSEKFIERSFSTLLLNNIDTYLLNYEKLFNYFNRAIPDFRDLLEPNDYISNIKIGFCTEDNTKKTKKICSVNKNLNDIRFNSIKNIAAEEFIYKIKFYKSMLEQYVKMNPQSSENELYQKCIKLIDRGDLPINIIIDNKTKYTYYGKIKDQIFLKNINEMYSSKVINFNKKLFLVSYKIDGKVVNKKIELDELNSLKDELVNSIRTSITNIEEGVKVKKYEKK